MNTKKIRVTPPKQQKLKHGKPMKTKKNQGK